MMRPGSGLMVPEEEEEEEEQQQQEDVAGVESSRDLEGRRTPRAPYNTDPASRLDGDIAKHQLVSLMPTRKKSRPTRRCRVCARRGLRSETRTLCRSCCVPLHAGECYTVYHTKRVYFS